MVDAVRRLAVPGVVVIAEIVLQLTGFQSMPLAIAIGLIGVAWGSWAFFTWSGTLKAWRNVRRLRIVLAPIHPDNASTSSPVTFYAERVRVSISQVDISGLLAKRSSNESVRLAFNVANSSGLSIRVKGVRGHIAISGEPQEPSPPELVLPGGKPIEVPFQTTRPAELRQVTAGLKQQLYEDGKMYGKNGVTAFAFSNIKLVCDVVMPDGSEEEQELRISDSRFLLRGPLRDDNDYETINRQSLSFGSTNWYGADGPNKKWYQID